MSSISATLQEKKNITYSIRTKTEFGHTHSTLSLSHQAMSTARADRRRGLFQVCCTQQVPSKLLYPQPPPPPTTDTQHSLLSEQQPADVYRNLN